MTDQINKGYSSRMALVKGLRRLKKIRDYFLNTKRTQEEELWKEFELYMQTWEPSERKVETLATKILAIKPKQRNQIRELGERL